MRNVVLVCLDTVRKDFFDAYARRLGAMADATYAQCRAASSWSVPSHASLLTGDLPSVHGIHADDRDFGSLPTGDTFLSSVPDHRTFGASANVFASSAFGFDAHFEEFVDVTTDRRFPEGMDLVSFLADVDEPGPRTYWEFLRAALSHDHPLQSLANGLTALLDDLADGRPVPAPFDDGAAAVLRECRTLVAEGDEPFVCFANLMDAHTPLRHTRGYDRDLHDAPDAFTTDEATVWDLMGSVEQYPDYCRHRRGLYGAAIDYLDRQVAGFVAWLRERTERPTTVVVTADHGENLGYPAEERMVRHKSSLSEGLLHVPLVVIDGPPGLAGTDDLVSHLDLGAFLVGLARWEDRGPAAALDGDVERADPGDGHDGDGTPAWAVDERGRPVWPDADRECVPAEVIGMSAGPSPPDDEEYWDRTIRAAYRGTEKVVWDSLEERREYALDRNRPCWQERVAEDVRVPPWARAAFAEPVAEFDRDGGDDASPRTASEAVERRLADLGYV